MTDQDITNPSPGMPEEGVWRLLAAKLDAAGIQTGNAEEFRHRQLERPDWIIEHMIAKGMKCDLVGKSKTRKTFLCLQLCICIAKGVDFLDFRVRRPRKTAYVNLELMDWFLQERLSRQDAGLGGAATDGLENLELVRVRGKGRLLREQAGTAIEYLRSLGTEFVAIDPQYKLLSAEEDENSGVGMQGILDFRDALAEYFGVILVSHDTKGEVGHKSISDRGAGSGFLGRDYDFRIVLTPHADNVDGHVVVSLSNRNCKTPPDFTAVFDDETQLFTPAPTIPAIMSNAASLRTGMDRAGRISLGKTERDTFRSEVLAIVGAAGADLLGKETLRARLDETACGAMGINKKRDLLNWMIENGELCVQGELEMKGDGSPGLKSRGRTLVSTPELVEAYRRRMKNEK